MIWKTIFYYYCDYDILVVSRNYKLSQKNILRKLFKWRRCDYKRNYDYGTNPVGAKIEGVSDYKTNDGMLSTGMLSVNGYTKG